MSMPALLLAAALAHADDIPVAVLASDDFSRDFTSGDFNGDGVTDLLVAAPYAEGLVVGGDGAALEFDGTATGYPPAPDVTLAGPGAYGSYVVAGDMDGDGFSDAAVYAYDGDTHDRQYLIHAGSTTGLDADGIGVALPSASCGLDLRGDADGDGLADLLMGSSGYDSGTDEYVCQPWLVRGSARDAFTPETLAVSTDAALAWAGDVDGDGRTDVLTSDWSDAVLWFDPISDAPSHQELDAYVLDESSVGDVDGDGYDDLALGSPREDVGVFVLTGSVTGAIDAPYAEIVLDGASHADAVSSAGDFDGDGFSDLIVGGDAAYGDVRAAFVYWGGPTGFFDEDRTTLPGQSDDYIFASKVEDLGPAFGDGTHALAASGESRVYVFGSPDDPAFEPAPPARSEGCDTIGAPTGILPVFLALMLLGRRSRGTILLPLLVGCAQNECAIGFFRGTDGNCHPGSFPPVADTADTGETAPPDTADTAPPPMDADGDGVSAESDCDDADRTVWAEGVYVGYLLAEDVADFCTGYCERDVTGNLAVERSDLVDLHGLECVHAIGGIVYIQDNPSLASLSALGHLESIGKDLILASNPSLPDLSGLGALETVGRDVDLDYNMPSQAGMENLHTIGGDLDIFDDQMMDLAWLSGLTAIGGDLTVENCDGLYFLTGLERLATVGGDLAISDMPVLMGLSSLSGLTTVGGDLEIDANPGIADLTGLDQLAAIGGSLVLSGNQPALQHLDGLESLTSIGGDLHLESTNLIDLTGLEHLDHVDGSVFIGWSWWGNDALVDLTGLEGLTSVGEDLLVHANESLADVSALVGLETVGHDVEITDNDTLSTADAENLVAQIEDIGGTVTIDGNAP